MSARGGTPPKPKTGPLMFPCGATYPDSDLEGFNRRAKRGRIRLYVFAAEGEPNPPPKPTHADGTPVSCLLACPTPKYRETIGGRDKNGDVYDKGVECVCWRQKPAPAKKEDVAANPGSTEALLGSLRAGKITEGGYLRLAVRAMADLAPEVLCAVTPGVLQEMLVNRGWRSIRKQDFPGEPGIVAFVVFDHAEARGQWPSSPWLRSPMVPLCTDTDDYGGRVADCITRTAERHGDAPAEVLADVLERLGRECAPYPPR